MHKVYHPSLFAQPIQVTNRPLSQATSTNTSPVSQFKLTPNLRAALPQAGSRSAATLAKQLWGASPKL